jgi:hypothetical protein
MSDLTEDRVKVLIADALERHEKRVMDHLDSGFDRLSQTFASAFPGGDPHGHRLAHEKAIRTASWWDKLKADVMGKFFVAGLGAAAAYAAFLVWEAIRTNIRNGGS